MYNKDIRRATTERALKTLVQTFVATTGANSLGIISSSAADNLKISLGGAVLSVLTSLASRGFGRPGPSLSVETVAPRIIEIPAAAPEPKFKVTVSTDKTKAKAKATVKKAAPAKKTATATASAKKSPAKKAPAKKAPAKKKTK